MFERIAYIQYTLRHRQAFRTIEKKFYGRVSIRGCLHDLDKVIMYPFFGVKLTNKIHRIFARHHVRRAKTMADYREMVIDWECARYTKLDKPLNAYDTLYKFYPQLEPVILPILKDLGIAHHTNVENEEACKWI